MTSTTLTKIRREIARCVRHETDALTSLYRIDNVLGEIDGLYEMDYSRGIDAKAEAIGEVGS